MTSDSSQSEALLIFVKNPRLGRVKTRIACELGDEQALEIYRYLLRRTREATENLPCQKFLFYSDFVEANDDWSDSAFAKRVQAGADLGERMADAFRRVFADAGVSRAVIIGSDCPDLTADLLTQAFSALETHDFVVGPARDGGYYLLGMKQLEERVFHNKRWSTPTVLADTLDDLRRLGKSFHLLPVLSDVDTVADLPAEVLDQIAGHQR